MKNLLATCFTVFALPALAGDITITVRTASPAVNASKTYTFSDADLGRLYTMVTERYGANRNAALEAWADLIIGDIIRDVQNADKARAIPAPMSRQ